MLKGKASLIVDLGNSETRVMTIFKDPQTGDSKQKLSIISNKFGELVDKDMRLLDNSDYTEDNSKVFRVNHDQVFCSGYICDREKGTATLRPSATIKKYHSDISMYSVRLALLEGFNHIAEITGELVELIDIDWTVTVLLPPSDLELGSDEIKKNIKNITRIDFLMPEITKNINIVDVTVFPEGFCAFIGEVFESRRKIREGFEKIIMSSTLVIDIGAGTTDLCIIKDAKLVDGSRHSIETGGNQIFQKMNTFLRRQVGRNFPEDSLRKASVSGDLEIGSQIIDATESIKYARKDVATRLSSEIRNYIESSDFSVFDIENILICGGGAEECGKGMKALGQFLKEDLEVWMSYSKFLDIPTYDEIVVKDGIQYLEKKRISPRLLNIIGASVLSEK
ncbi:hypothetical protein ACEE21_14580 [Clostridium baratii]